MAPGCNDTSAATWVNVYALPTPTVSYDPGANLLSTSSAYGTYQWYLNTVSIPGANSYTLVPPNIGSYRVVVTDVHGCHNFSGPYILNSLDVNQVTGTDVNIYPNPASSTIHVTSSVDLRAVIMSMEGKKILDQAAAKDIDVSSLSQGLYIPPSAKSITAAIIGKGPTMSKNSAAPRTALLPVAGFVFWQSVILPPRMVPQLLQPNSMQAANERTTIFFMEIVFD